MVVFLVEVLLYVAGVVVSTLGAMLLHAASVVVAMKEAPDFEASASTPFAAANSTMRNGCNASWHTRA